MTYISVIKVDYRICFWILMSYGTTFQNGKSLSNMIIRNGKENIFLVVRRFRVTFIPSWFINNRRSRSLWPLTLLLADRKYDITPEKMTCDHKLHHRAAELLYLNKIMYYEYHYGSADFFLLNLNFYAMISYVNEDDRLCLLFDF